MFSIGIPDTHVAITQMKKPSGMFSKRTKKTDVIKNQFDPIYNKKNLLEMDIERNRTNVVVYVYDKMSIGNDKLIGGVNFDLQYLPANTMIEDWFTLSNFGDNEKATTGKILLRVTYVVGGGDSTFIKIQGHSKSCMKHVLSNDNYVKQIEKQTKKRGKKSPCPNQVVEDEVVCKVPTK